MGKSPGKWIKTLLFGKKSFKSSFSKGREKVGNEKEVWIAANAPEADLALDPPVSSDLTRSVIQKNEGKLEDRREAMNLPLEGMIPVPENRDAHTQETTEQDAPKDPERIRQEHAATTAQAALRGYMARRAFRALKGIIRLQALVRGHFVRRQAVSTLHCVLGIVKLQAIVRGRKIRQYDIGIEVQKKCILVKPSVPSDSELADPVEVNKSVQIAKLSANAYAHKLLASSPTAMPLHLHYDIGEPNSVLNWLECWSASRFWRPTPQPKRVPGPKSQKKQVNSTTVDTHKSRLKHSTRRAPAANVDSISMHSTTEFEKPRRNLRKISRHSADSVQENPQHELEKVKRSLRKVHNPIMQSAVQPEIEIEKSKQNLGKVLSSSAQDVSERSMSDSAEKMKIDTAVTETKLPYMERNPEPIAVNEAIELLQDVKTAAELQPVGNSGKDDKIPGTNGEDDKIPGTNGIDDNIPGTNGEDDKSPGTNGTDDQIPGTNGEFSFKDDLTSNENQKSRQQTSFSAKQERAENDLQSRPTLPSYMATTQSAKAKLRGQGSPRLGQDVPEKHNLTRRHSLPSLTNSKTSPSPRAQRSVQATGKGGNRSDRSLLSSRDGIVKVNQAEWRR